MATYTDNYTMTKPTYAEQADISVINANMDIIDDVMHSSQISLAPAYDINETYNTGDIVMHELLMYKCLEDNVTGAWDSTKWIRTTAGEESGGGADLDIYGEASGTAEASFSDGAEASLVECEIGIVPTQDLHGYSKPWAGGAGKNKLPLTVANIKASNTSNPWVGNETTINGIKYTILTDSDGNVTGINADGTATANSIIYLMGSAVTPVDLDGQSVTISMVGFNRGAYRDNSWHDIYTPSTDLTATIDGNLTQMWGQINSGVTVDDLNIYPMVRLPTEPSGFEPYSNICPISGHTDVTVTVASTSGGSGEDTTVSLGRTVYSGTLDVTTGELTVTHELVTAPTRGNVDSSGKLYTLVFSPSIAIKSWGQTEAPSTYIKSNMFDVEGLSEARASEDKCLVQYGTAIYVGGYIGEESALDTLLATLQIKYELATPQTFTLTPTQVLTLLGQNYVSHDGGGTISLVYIKKDSTIIPNPSDAEVPLTGLEISGKDFVITDARIPAPPTMNGAYVLTVTVTGGTPTYSWENA